MTENGTAGVVDFDISPLSTEEAPVNWVLVGVGVALVGAGLFC